MTTLVYSCVHLLHLVKSIHNGDKADSKASPIVLVSAWKVLFYVPVMFQAGATAIMFAVVFEQHGKAEASWPASALAGYTQD